MPGRAREAGAEFIAAFIFGLTGGGNPFEDGFLGFLEWLNNLPGRAREAGAEFIAAFIFGLTGGGNPFEDGFLGFLEWLNNLPGRAREAGAEFIAAFIAGLVGSKSELDSTMREIVGNIRMFLPFSDAKVGPLSDLTESGKRLIQTLGRGIEMGGNLPLADALLPVGPVPTQAAGGGSGGMTMTLVIERLEVNVPSGNPQVVQQATTDGVMDAARALVEEFDSRIRA